MVQKQILGVVLGVLVMGTLGYFVYQQFSARPMGTVQKISESQNRMMNPETMKKEEVVPDKIDDISSVIAGESSMDLTALEEEEAGEASSLDEDSDTVNNLGTSYDENEL